MRLVNESTFFMSEEKVREHAINGKIGIHYSGDCYRHDFAFVSELREEVRKNYPDVKDEDIQIWTLTRGESDRHAGFTTLYFSIPIDEYLRLRKEGKIQIR